MDAMPTAYYSYARRRQSSGPGACAVGLFFAAVFAYLFFVASSMAAGPLSLTLPEKDSYEVRDYATRATYSARDGSVFYGDARERRAPAAPPPGDAYEQVARGMPVARVDVALARGDGRMLLVQRAREPARGLWRWPGGRLPFGETFFEAAERIIRDEVGVEAEARAVLLTTNAFFPEGAGGGAAQTVNVLVLAALAGDAPADSLEICGDRPGPCRARGVRSLPARVDARPAQATTAPSAATGGRRSTPSAAATPTSPRASRRRRAFAPRRGPRRSTLPWPRRGPRRSTLPWSPERRRPSSRACYLAFGRVCRRRRSVGRRCSRKCSRVLVSCVSR